MQIPYVQIQMSCLMTMAAMLRAKTLDEAHGRCFSLSLDLCAQATQQDIPVDLIVWQIAHDKQFLEHWAVLIEKSKVIDLSRVQIDDKKGLVFDIDDYPENFHSPRIYPSSLFLSQYVMNRSEENDRLASRFFWKSRMALCRYDIVLAIRSSKISQMFDAICALAKFCMLHPLNSLLRRLEGRKQKLLKRLTNQ